MSQDEIVKGAKCTKDDLTRCGWTYSYTMSYLEVWTQAKDTLYYDPKIWKIMSVQQKKKGGKNA